MFEGASIPTLGAFDERPDQNYTFFGKSEFSAIQDILNPIQLRLRDYFVSSKPHPTTTLFYLWISLEV